MLKDKIKKIFAKEEDKEGEGDNKKKIENLVVFVVILIITLIAINLIWSKDTKKNENSSNEPNKRLTTTTETVSTNTTMQDELSKQLEEILEKIDGVGNVKVLITYSQTNESIPMYNEDTSQKDTEEQDKSGGTRKVTETDVKREVVYQESNGEKTPITQSIVSPKVEGAIVTAQGASNATVKTNIIQAVEAVTGISSHKIQVFTMTGDVY